MHTLHDVMSFPAYLEYTFYLSDRWLAGVADQPVDLCEALEIIFPMTAINLHQTLATIWEYLFFPHEQWLQTSL